MGRPRHLDCRKIACFWLFAGFFAFGQATARLSTADTVLQLEAGAHDPRLVELRTADGGVWLNSAPESLIPYAILGTAQKPLRWHFDKTRSRIGPERVAFTYEADSPRLRLTWEWTARTAFGPLEHQIRIENLSSEEIWLPLQDSFRFRWKVNSGVKLNHLYVEKGADTPSPVGTHLESVTQGYQWDGFSSTYAHPQKGEAREIIPLSLVERRDRNSGWYVGIEFSGRTRISLERTGASLEGTAGLNPNPGPFRTRLAAGGVFETPVIFVGGFAGGIDGASNVLHRWVREVLGNPGTWENPHYPLTVNNSWGGGMDINESVAKRMIRDAADLGLEMFHIDAGWFRGVGDWYPNPKKFPNGLAAIADDAHQHGLKFGLWVDWTQAALDTAPGALNARDPQVRDWLVNDLSPDWKPEPFKGQTIDIGAPDAKAWAQREVERIVDDYHLDMLEHDGYLLAQGCIRTDHPHAPPDRDHMHVYHDVGNDFVDSSNSTDVSYHSVRAYYDIYSKMRRSHPGLIFEVCNDGGRMVDFGSAAHADYFSITDTYDPLSNRRAFYDASWVLPPAMLEAYVERWPTPRPENLRYMLRSGMMGWFTLMLDPTAWTAGQHDIAREEIQLYKSELRPLIRDASLYHISDRPDGVHWDGMEYFDGRSGRGVVYAFHGSAENEPRHTFLLKALHSKAMYHVRFHDHSSPDRLERGASLMQHGLQVVLPLPHSAEIIFLDEVHH
jgi:Melibiase